MITPSIQNVNSSFRHSYNIPRMIVSSSINSMSINEDINKNNRINSKIQELPQIKLPSHSHNENQTKYISQSQKTFIRTLNDDDCSIRQEIKSIPSSLPNKSNQSKLTNPLKFHPIQSRKQLPNGSINNSNMITKTSNNVSKTPNIQNSPFISHISPINNNNLLKRTISNKITGTNVPINPSSKHNNIRDQPNINTNRISSTTTTPNNNLKLPNKIIKIHNNNINSLNNINTSKYNDSNRPKNVLITSKSVNKPKIINTTPQSTMRMTNNIDKGPSLSKTPYNNSYTHNYNDILEKRNIRPLNNSSSMINNSGNSHNNGNKNICTNDKNQAEYTLFKTSIDIIRNTINCPMINHIRPISNADNKIVMVKKKKNIIDNNRQKELTNKFEVKDFQIVKNLERNNLKSLVNEWRYIIYQYNFCWYFKHRIISNFRMTFEMNKKKLENIKLIQLSVRLFLKLRRQRSEKAKKKIHRFLLRYYHSWHKKYKLTSSEKIRVLLTSVSIQKIVIHKMKRFCSEAKRIQRLFRRRIAQNNSRILILKMIYNGIVETLSVIHNQLILPTLITYKFNKNDTFSFNCKVPPKNHKVILMTQDRVNNSICSFFMFIQTKRRNEFYRETAFHTHDIRHFHQSDDYVAFNDHNKMSTNKKELPFLRKSFFNYVWTNHFYKLATNLFESSLLYDVFP